MGLFKKPAKFREYQVKCVHCGRTHTLRKYFATEYYLDGVPKLTEAQRLEQYAICECGAFIYLTSEYNPVTKQVMQTPEYQEVFKLPAEEQYNAFLRLLFPHTLSVHMELLHQNYTPQQLAHCLSCCAKPNAVMSSFNSATIKALNAPKGIFEYSAALCEIDVLRQLGKWDECLAKIQSQRERDFPPLSAKRARFLEIEENLVTHKDSSVQ